mmetsp:Transcript_4080/g.8308  ORF Transcript_4080/g.8308 Transcript_4080/m.8308 type:complete len:257 (+) Transcript_4080:6-776(+)
MQRCLLDDPNLGPITEIDHKLSQCICSECTCGKHICPYLRVSHADNPKTSCKSLYQTQYRRHSASRTRPVIREDQLRFLKGKMDLTTMNQSFFKPHAAESAVILRPFTTKPSFKFSAESSYKASYPDWGPLSSTQATPKKEQKKPSMKFTGESSYNTSFTAKNLESASKSFVHASCKNLLDMSYEKKLETTSQSYYRKANSYLRGPSYEKHKGIVQYEVPSSLYQTEFRRSYQKQTSPYKDPKAIKRQRKEVKVST